MKIVFQKNPLWILAASLFAILAFDVQMSNVQAAPYIAVGTARTRKSNVYFPNAEWKGSAVDSQGIAKLIHKTVSDDLLYMDLFKLQPGNQTKMDAGTEFAIKTQISVQDKKINLEGIVTEIVSGKEILNKKLVAVPNDVKYLAHTFANHIVEALTGQPGVFLTKIAMSCDRTGKKEIYTMDFDGSNVKQITSHKSIAFAPAWSPDGTRLAYSLYTRHKGNLKNIDLYEYNFRTNNVKLLSNRKGINSGAQYHPDGKRLALTMSFLGNPEVFLLDPDQANVTRMTNSFGFDVDPAISPDGKLIAFVSSRSGKPMIYSMKSDGSDVKRLTYAGRYNATPGFSPDGRKLTFAGWLEGVFDIFIMNSDGTTIERLTKGQGNNEDPTYSPDGNFIAFSSSRAGGKNIYVMNSDGSFSRRLTFGLGNCVAPKWSSPPQ